jgi:hypothetical protein
MEVKLQGQEGWLNGLQRQRRWFFYGIQVLCLFGCSNLVQGALMWEFSTTDGNSGFGGTLTTDGVYADTQGTGSQLFEVAQFTLSSAFVNGENVFRSVDEKNYNGIENRLQFTWSRDDGMITATQTDTDNLVGVGVGVGGLGVVAVAFPSLGSMPLSN